jgi:hypothetical protein
MQCNIFLACFHQPCLQGLLGLTMPSCVCVCIQAIISHVFKKRIRATIQDIAQQHAADAAAAAAEEGKAGAGVADTDTSAAAAAAPPAATAV